MHSSQDPLITLRMIFWYFTLLVLKITFLSALLLFQSLGTVPLLVGSRLTLMEPPKGALGHSGCGGIFKTCQGFVKGCFSAYLGICSAFEAEIMGLILAIEAGHQFNWNTLWVKTDSIFVLWALESKTLHVPWIIINRWIRALCFSEQLKLTISHIFLEGNCVADKLAISATVPGTLN